MIDGEAQPNYIRFPVLQPDASPLISDHDIPLLPKLPFEIEEYILSIFYSSEDISPSRLHGDLFAPTYLWGEGPSHLGHTPQVSLVVGYSTHKAVIHNVVTDRARLLELPPAFIGP